MTADRQAIAIVGSRNFPWPELGGRVWTVGQDEPDADFCHFNGQRGVL